MNHLLRSALVLSLLASPLTLAAEPLQGDRPVPGQPVWEPQINVTPEEIAARMQYFDLVVLVNKASSAQTINVYKNVSGQPQEILNSRVSTGVEEYNCHYPVDKVTGWITSKSIYTQTPAGYYTALNVDIDHYSGAYDDAHMPFAVFMNDPTGAATGIATHIAPGGSEVLIGHRESHGCMRLTTKDAQEVFKLVLQTGGPISFASENMRARCNPGNSDPRDNSGACLGNQDTRARAAFYANWLSKNVTQSLYPTAPLVPTIDRSGNYINDKNGQIKMRAGYKTLYIIENVETGAATDQVYRGTKKVKVKGEKPAKYTEVAVYRKAQTEPVSCRSEQELNSGRQNPAFVQNQYDGGRYRSRDQVSDFFGTLFGGNRQQEPQYPSQPRRRY